MSAKQEIVLGVVIGLAIGAVAFFGWGQYQERQQELANLRAQVESLQHGEQTDNESEEFVEVDESTQDSMVGEEATPAESTAEETNETVVPVEDEYASWRTYRNTIIGYVLKYPSDWTIEEVYTYSELMGEDVKYILLHSNDDKYTLYWGIAKKSADYRITDRTGIGAGDVVGAGSMTIWETTTPIEKLVFSGEIQEVFFGGVGSQMDVADGKRVFAATLGQAVGFGSGDDLADALPTAKKVLQSIHKIDRDDTDCPSTLTLADKQETENWKVYKNEAYEYSFSYPASWTRSGSDEVVTLENGNMTLQVRSGPATSIGFFGFTLDEDRERKIGCVLSGRSLMTREESGLLPKITKSKVQQRKLMNVVERGSNGRHIIMLDFEQTGNNVPQSLFDTYDLILKTIVFDD